jgi:hypothetical protein
MDHDIITMMDSSEFYQAITNPRKRTNSIVKNDTSLDCGHPGKKTRHLQPLESTSPSPPPPPFEDSNLSPASPLETLSPDPPSLSETQNQQPASATKTPAFTTYRLTMKKDGSVYCLILGFYESMDEANFKVIESWDPAWARNDGTSARFTRKNGAIWWQKEEIVSLPRLFFSFERALLVWKDWS